MSDKTISQRLDELALVKHAEIQRARVSAAVRQLDRAPYADQYPGKAVPACFSKLYGPIDMAAPRRLAAATGFDKLAAVVTTQTPVLPRGKNILVPRGSEFYWCSTNVAGFITWTWASAVLAEVPVNPKAPGDIFDRAIEDNGGAQVLMNFSSADAFGDKPRLCFEVDLYDRKRGRSLTDGKLPSESLLGLSYGFKENYGHLQFPEDTEIEPRVYVTEFRPGSTLSTNALFNAARVKGYLNLVFKGYYVLG